MTTKTLERRLARLQAKQRSFDSWTDQELSHAIQLFSRAADELTRDEERQRQSYAAKTPPIPEEIAAMPEEVMERQIQKLAESLGFGVKE